MQSKIKNCNTEFWHIKKCEILLTSKIAQILSDFLNSKWDSPQQMKWQFIVGCMVGFQVILDQRLAFATLDINWNVHASAFANYRVGLFCYLANLGKKAACKHGTSLNDEKTIRIGWKKCTVYWNATESTIPFKFCYKLCKKIPKFIFS